MQRLETLTSGRSATGPLIQDTGVVAVVPNQWDIGVRARHHIMLRLARYFHVVWVNPARALKDIITKKVDDDRAKNDLPRLPGLQIYRPEPWLPEVYRPHWLRAASSRLRLKRAYRLLCDQGVEKVILYLAHPQFTSALDVIPFDLSCYHIVDEYSYSPVELPLDQAEIQLIERVDQVFVHSSGLLDRKGKINPNTYLVPNGVDYHAFADPVSEPADLAAIPHPRIGYVGSMKKQLDWQLLEQLSFEHPEWSFVFVGAQLSHSEIRAITERMCRYVNAHFLGAKTASELQTYPQHIDVCIMPYKIDDYTKFIYPLKLHEYLATGRPVVGSPIRTLQEFSSVVRLARTTAEWSDAIESCLLETPNTEASCARRRVAQQHDWEILVKRIALLMCAGLGPEASQRLEVALQESDATPV
jgi:glycosyltransferase involved in cell wall biosynthesis